MLLTAAVSAASAAISRYADQVETLAWTDPDRALQVMSRLPAAADDLDAIEVRAMVYASLYQDGEVEALLSRLEDSARRGNRSARRAAHFVRAYWLFERDQYAAASEEIGQVDIASAPTDAERYRISILRGNALRMLGQADVALPFLERGLDLAHDMHDDLRALHATLWLAKIYIGTDNLDRAATLLEDARHEATVMGNEDGLVEVEVYLSDVADRRNEHSEERRASLSAMEHAERSGSSLALSHALINLGDSYLKTHDYAESLKYSKLALPLVMRQRASGREAIVLSNEGVAYIGLGSVKLGQKMEESAIAKALAGDNFLDAKEILREYAEALERAGYLVMAIQAYHRLEDISDKSMSDARQRAFLELSAKFDDERRAREMELLRRDNALKASEMLGQRLRQQLIIAAALFVTFICAALVWAFARVRRANDRLRYDSERDALTSLFNRRYFNERVLKVDGAKPVVGCVLLADLDHFKRINDTWGHPAGDAVLATVSHRLKAALRESDRLVRWGGEEFLALLNPITVEQANATVERLLEAVRQDPVMWNDAPIHCSVSIGYACFPMPGSTTGITLDHAISLVDKALYEAKRRGRDRACLIGGMSAVSETDISSISTEFDFAATDRRIRLIDMGVAA